MSFIPYHEDEDSHRQMLMAQGVNVLRISGVHSDFIRIHRQFYNELMVAPGPLTLAQRELIATAVSAANRCRY